ncbi:MAG: hypothetical protein CVT48_05400 [Thermoplasmata archaeon HGW-Thermoplasmata-1]|nr:MAG: hypothetical protein CVT48_05400 [Thermoplasmata archaeon HGW-Thermoplasmata-1]
MLEKGSAVYFAATRTTWGQVGEIPDSPAYSYEDQGIGGAQGLGYLLYNYMITENCTTGEALMKAKNEFIDNSGNFFGLLDSLRFEIMWEYQLYGDPAFNPYEPCNEGTNYGS